MIAEKAFVLSLNKTPAQTPGSDIAAGRLKSSILKLNFNITGYDFLSAISAEI